MAGKKHKNSKNVKNSGKVREFKLEVKIQNYLHYNNNNTKIYNAHM